MIVYACDFHYGAHPISRKDNYNQSILKKLKQVLEFCQKKGYVLLLGGDLFDTPKLSIYDLIPIINLFTKYSSVNIFSLRGNHNHDGSPELSPLFFLNQYLPNFIITDKINNYNLNNNVNLVFANNTDNPLSKEDWMEDDKINILMTHHLIVKKKMIYDHYLIDDFKTKADIVLLADYHPRQGIFKENDTLFVSPGAISRKKNTTSDRKRQPAIALIDVNHRNPIVKLKGIKCEADVFVDIIEDESDEEELDINVKELNKLIDEDLTGGDIETMLKTYAKKINSNTEMLNYVLKKLEGIS